MVPPVHYGVRREDGLLDYEELERVARAERPKLIIAGGSAYARIIDFARIRRAADEVGALFMVDMAHFAGLVAAGLYPSPLPHAHVVTTTTHKTLRGPRGGMILTNDAEIGKKINSAVFPGLQGGPLMHVIAAKAVAFGEALRPEFRAYQQAVAENARALAATLIERGLRDRRRRHRQPPHAGRSAAQARHRQGRRGEPGAGARSPPTRTPSRTTRKSPPSPRASGSARRPPPRAASALAEFREVGRMIAAVIDGLARSNDGANDAAEQAVAARVRALVRALSHLSGALMHCPFCGNDDTQVKDSRPSEDGAAIRRRRFCPGCGQRFTTVERVQLRELTVVKSDGRRVPFDRDKLARSIRVALRKRPVEDERIERIVNGIVRQLEASGEAEVPSKQLGELVMETLKEVDAVAYVRFASVYRNFREAKDFEAFVGALDEAT